MEALKLTEEHKAKLLEMCKVLFPEYETSFGRATVSSTAKWGGFYQQYDYLRMLEPNEPYELFIHWFEFCITHLSKAVYTIDGKVMSGYINFFHNFNYKKQHPVDYLYQEFKKP